MITAWEGIFCHNFFSTQGEWIPCRSEIWASCYHAYPGLVFPLNKLLGDEPMYCKIMREDESRYLVAMKGDWILAPHQYEKCWLVNSCGCCPDSGSLSDSQNLASYKNLTWTYFGATPLQWFMDVGLYKGTGNQSQGYEQSSTIACHHILAYGWGYQFRCWSNYCQKEWMAVTIFSSTWSGSCERRHCTYTQPQLMIISVITPLILIAEVYFTYTRERFSSISWRGFPRGLSRGFQKIQTEKTLKIFGDKLYLEWHWSWMGWIRDWSIEEERNVDGWNLNLSDIRLLT